MIKSFVDFDYTILTSNGEVSDRRNKRIDIIDSLEKYQFRLES
jgi:hypothetical protein